MNTRCYNCYNGKVMADTIKTLSRKDFSDIFPGLLEISEPPEKVYVRGKLPEKGAVLLTVVGSRKHSHYGKDVCERIIHGLSGAPIAIVSGLALGIDSIAHRAALDAGLPTIAVPGSGLTETALYPREHAGLAREIVESGGLLISEFEPDFRAVSWSFPKRNRVMAGLSRAVLVIEAEERSGTLITARFALEYGKDVLAVPGSVFSETSRGTHSLLKQGAVPITDARDVLDALGFALPALAAAEKTLEEATDEERELYELLAEPKSRAELGKETKLPVAAQNIALSVLEIKGLVKEEGGKWRRA